MGDGDGRFLFTQKGSLRLSIRPQRRREAYIGSVSESGKMTEIRGMTEFWGYTMMTAFKSFTFFLILLVYSAFIGAYGQECTHKLKDSSMQNSHATVERDDSCLSVGVESVKKDIAVLVPTIELTVTNCGIRQISLADLEGPVFNLYSEGYERVRGINLGGTAYVAFTDISKFTKDKRRVLNKGESVVSSIVLDKLNWSEMMVSYHSVVSYAEIKSGTYSLLVEIGPKPRSDAAYTPAFKSNELHISVP